MNGDEVGRRTMLKSVIAIAGASCFPMLSSCQNSDSKSPLEGLNKDSIKMIGMAYLEQFPKDHGIMDIKTLLNTSQTNDELINQLQQLMRSDYENNQTVNLFGWNISRTEGRIFSVALDIFGE